LKSRFITLAQEAGRSSLANGTAPVPLPLPEADRSDMEYFIAHAKIILPVLGVKILRSTAIASSNPAETSAIPPLAPSPVFEPHLKKEGTTATAREVDGEFAVLQGSAARTTWTSVEHAYKGVRDKLVREGAIAPAPDGQRMRFARDQVFASPSAAAAAVIGRNTNGRIDWKVQGTGLSFGTWQAQHRSGHQRRITRPSPLTGK
jgi:Domain of unknown function (DUF4357)